MELVKKEQSPYGWTEETYQYKQTEISPDAFEKQKILHQITIIKYEDGTKEVTQDFQ